MTRISKNFKLEEFTRSSTADRYGIENTPKRKDLIHIIELTKNILQPLRDIIGKPIRITSGYRCPELNKKIGGSKTSDHMVGKAADIELWVEGEEKNELLFHTIINSRLPFKQLIWEYGTSKKPHWIHISYDKNNNKKEILKAMKTKRGTVYKDITKTFL